MTVKTGRLFVVATPIGNLEDITLRALKTLREVDLIVCEDTKQSRKLLSHYGISKQLISYYKPKERDKANKIIDILLSGKDVALISDAGTPAISDPGQILIDEARKNGIEILAIPGPSSLITALSVSGFKIIPFMFDGFIPKKRSDLIKRLEELKGIASTLVYFVPSRAIGDFLNIVKNILGERRILIARELTKIYEEVIIGTPSDLLKCEIVEKGEVVVIIEGKEIKENYLIDDNIEEDLLDAIKEKKSFKDIIKNDKFKNIRRNELYRLYESLKKSGNLNGGNP